MTLTGRKSCSAHFHHQHSITHNTVSKGLLRGCPGKCSELEFFEKCANTTNGSGRVLCAILGKEGKSRGQRTTARNARQDLKADSGCTASVSSPLLSVIKYPNGLMTHCGEMFKVTRGGSLGIFVILTVTALGMDCYGPDPVRINHFGDPLTLIPSSIFKVKLFYVRYFAFFFFFTKYLQIYKDVPISLSCTLCLALMLSC